VRRRKKHAGLTVNVVAGTHVVFFGLDLAAARRPGCRGFAFKRHDHREGDTIWLQGLKTFRETEPFPAPGERFSTLRHPVQGFQWADYSAKPDTTYTYAVAAMYGDPASLEQRVAVEIEIATEAEVGSVHSAFFNRGSVATQEYARRFQNQPPNVAGPGAYQWLSRGLLEAFEAFVGRAGTGWEVHAAMYEFQWPDALAAIRKAHQRGAKVRVIFDDVGPKQKNEAAIKAAKIRALCRGRSLGKLMHNKFVVLSEQGTPKAVWTGSTNLTENGIFGHANVGHIVEDAAVAQAFRDYWDRLAADPPVAAGYRSANEQATPAPPHPWKAATTSVFSPRGTELDALEWYADIAAGAKQGLFMTFAFGMNEKFRDVYRTDDDTLRMALMEKEWGNPRTRTQETAAIQQIRNRRNVVVAVGNRIVTNSFDRWLAEMSRIDPDVHVYWVHLKFMLVDPLGPRPTVVTGSANFSKASTDTNDENMLVIRGDTRIADIYFGEYLRLYTHYAFREAVKIYMKRQKHGSPEDWKPQFLVNADSWMNPYFDPHDRSARDTRRRYFGGPMGGSETLH
jgi:phosphatidylserine/phosphatidylglycerophosphate/cardiolipin synthase-like enzyme